MAHAGPRRTTEAIYGTNETEVVDVLTLKRVEKNSANTASATRAANAFQNDLSVAGTAQSAVTSIAIARRQTATT
jgi:hypothetical protein